MICILTNGSKGRGHTQRFFFNMVMDYNTYSKSSLYDFQWNQLVYIWRGAGGVRDLFCSHSNSLAHVDIQVSKWQSNDLKPWLSDLKAHFFFLYTNFPPLGANLIPKPSGDEDSCNQRILFRIFLKSECGQDAMWCQGLLWWLLVEAEQAVLARTPLRHAEPLMDGLYTSSFETMSWIPWSLP